MRLLIAGAGGHGRVVADLASEAGWTAIAFLDDRYPEMGKSGDWNVVGTLRDLQRMKAAYDACVCAIGDAILRLKTLERASQAGFATPALLHPRATVSRRARIAEGSVVVAGGVVNTGCDIGTACIVNTGATVDHDCRLAPGVHICPGGHLAGGVQVGARTWFGIGAVAIQGIRIGSDVTVGAGAVCLDDVPDGVAVYGIPAREKQT